MRFSNKNNKNSEASLYLPTSKRPYPTRLISMIALRGYTNFVPRSLSEKSSLICDSSIQKEQNLSLLSAYWTVADLRKS